MMSALLICLLSLQSRVVINEVMAHPAGGTGAHSPDDRNEFVELYNLTGDTIDLQGWHLTDFDSPDTLCAWTDTTIRLKYPHVRTNSTLIYPHYFALVLDPEYTDTAPRGGYVQPYHFTDRLLLLRPGNTTIGNGLSNSNLLMLWSPSGTDTSTFGVVSHSDTFPRDAGADTSWERVAPDAPDAETCWYRSTDTTGCSPGRTNSVTTFTNLAVENLLGFPLRYSPNTPETIVLNVRNTGRTEVHDWAVRVYCDIDSNGRENGMERIAHHTGCDLAPGTETTLVTTWQGRGPGTCAIVAELDCPLDQQRADNRVTATLSLGLGAQSFALSASRFGPNLHTGPETLAINYSLPDDKGTLVITVCDLSGRQRAIIYHGRPQGRYGIISWDGRDKTGSFLATSLYIIAFEYKSGKQSIYEKKTVVFARRP